MRTLGSVPLGQASIRLSYGTMELPNETNGTNDTNTALLLLTAAVFVSFVPFVSFGSSSRPWPATGSYPPTSDKARSPPTFI